MGYHDYRPLATAQQKAEFHGLEVYRDCFDGKTLYRVDVPGQSFQSLQGPVFSNGHEVLAFLEGMELGPGIFAWRDETKRRNMLRAERAKIMEGAGSK